MNIKITYLDGATKIFDSSQWDIFGKGIMLNLVDKGLAKMEETNDQSTLMNVSIDLAKAQKMRVASIVSGMPGVEISKSDFKEWPFKHDKVKVYKRNTNMIFCEIDNAFFGLNGNSGMYYGFTNVTKTKHHIKGKSISHIIEFGLNM